MTKKSLEDVLKKAMVDHTPLADKLDAKVKEVSTKAEKADSSVYAEIAPESEPDKQKQPKLEDMFVDTVEVLKTAYDAPTAILQYGRLKKTAKHIDELLKAILGKANADFVKIQEQHPDDKQYLLEDGLIAKAYTKAATYNYPAEVVEAEKKLAKLKAKARKDGTAVKTAHEVDPARDVTFSISVS